MQVYFLTKKGPIDSLLFRTSYLKSKNIIFRDWFFKSSTLKKFHNFSIPQILRNFSRQKCLSLINFITALCSRNFQNVKLRYALHNARIYLHLNFVWNQFCQNLNLKNCHFTISETLSFEFWQIRDLRNGSNWLKMIFKTHRSAKMTFLDRFNSPKFDFA